MVWLAKWIREHQPDARVYIQADASETVADFQDTGLIQEAHAGLVLLEVDVLAGTSDARVPSTTSSTSNS